MKLSRLVYECVRDSVNMPGQTLSYDDFVASFSEKQKAKDLALQISVVFEALNKALSRLYDKGKVEPFVSYFTASADGLVPLKVLDVATDEEVVTDVLAVFRSRRDGGYDNLEWRREGRAVRLLISDLEAKELARENAHIGVEYKKRFPHWDYDCMLTNSTISDASERARTAPAYRTELDSEYHVTNIACDYIKEYVKASAMEPMAPDIAIQHFQRAETYLQQMTDWSGPIHQVTHIRNVWGGLFS